MSSGVVILYVITCFSAPNLLTLNVPYHLKRLRLVTGLPLLLQSTTCSGGEERIEKEN